MATLCRFGGLKTWISSVVFTSCCRHHCTADAIINAATHVIYVHVICGIMHQVNRWNSICNAFFKLHQSGIQWRNIHIYIYSVPHNTITNWNYNICSHFIYQFLEHNNNRQKKKFDVSERGERAKETWLLFSLSLPAPFYLPAPYTIFIIVNDLVVCPVFVHASRQRTFLFLILYWVGLWRWRSLHGSLRINYLACDRIGPASKQVQLVFKSTARITWGYFCGCFHFILSFLWDFHTTSTRHGTVYICLNAFVKCQILRSFVWNNSIGNVYLHYFFLFAFSVANRKRYIFGMHKKIAEQLFWFSSHFSSTSAFRGVFFLSHSIFYYIVQVENVLWSVNCPFINN